MIELSKRRSPGRQKSMCFAATGRLQGRAAKLLLVRRKSWYNEELLAICLTANGPVVWGVAVCVRVGMCFCKVLVSGQDFRVTIKLSR
jgi:hypothetical protein